MKHVPASAIDASHTDLLACRPASQGRERQQSVAGVIFGKLCMLGENLQTVEENREIFIKASKDIGLKKNSEKTKYMITSYHQNVVQN